MPRYVNKEEFMSEFGYDPTPDLVPVTDEGGGVKDHLKSTAVGVLSLPGTVANIPSTLYAGGKAAVTSYMDDKPFFEEFGKNISVEGAQGNLQKHIDDVAASWRAQDPTLTNEEIQKGMKEYQESKQFEDFRTTQLSGTHWLAAKNKELARSLLGDERPESKRSWTESAAEVLGGALVGGPAGWAGRAATIPGIAAVAANPVGKAAIRTAEAVTPLTIPYTPLNVGVNAAVGVGIDQGLRYAQGQSTAFTPTPQDTAGVGTMAAGGAIVVGSLAFVNAIRGRTNAALHAAQANPSPTAVELANMPTLDARIRPEPRTGEAFMVSGRDQQLGPTSELGNMPWLRSTRRRVRDLTMDKGAAADAQIRDIHGRDVSDELEVIRTSNSGPVLNDAIESDASNALRPVLDAFQGLSPEDARAHLTGWWNTSYASDIDTLISRNQDEVTRLTAQIHNPKSSPQTIGSAQTKLTQLQADLQRLIGDTDTDVRMRIPETPIADVRHISNTWLNDMSPGAVKVRDAVKAYNRQMLDLSVQAEKMTLKASNDLHARNPYYVQAVNDPLGSKVGVHRLFESIAHDVNARLTRTSEGTGGAAAHEGPLRHLDTDIHKIRGPLDPETRITAPLNPISAAANYTRQMYRDVAHTRVRNEYVRALAYSDRRSTPSAYLTDGRMRTVKTPQGGDWWAGGMLQRPELHSQMRRSDVIAEWQNGKVRLWEFGDPEIPRALRFEPVIMSGLMKLVQVSSNTMKFFTTGRGNPSFALKGALYDTGIAMLTRPANRSFGTASYLAHRFMPTLANKVGRYVPDPTAYTALPWHAFASFVELQAYHMSNALARYLPSQVPGFAALQATVGQRMFQGMLHTALRVASWAEQRPAAVLHRAGATRGAQTIDNVSYVRNAFTILKDKVPTPARATWQFYTDILDSFYLANKRQYYSQNYALEARRNGGVVPDKINERLINETRRMAGDMSMVPASKTMRDLEAFFPYLTQTKLGAYHLTRNMFSRDTAMATNAKLMIAMSGVAMSFHMMTHWDEKSKDYFWNRMPEYDRWRNVFIPHPKLLLAWAQGKNLPFSHDLFYKVPVPPDISGIIAGSVAFMQMMGGIPADATVKPIAKDVPNVFIDSIIPAMPPALQTLLAFGNIKLDPATSETRGGNVFRSIGSNFRSGPQAEAASNLGQVSNSTSLLLSGIFGAMGAHLAQGTDIMLHAAKFHPQVGANAPVPRQSMDFGAGLRAATTRVFNEAVSKIPDVPLIWKGEEKAVASTPAWKYVNENMNHVRSVVGMRDHADGKAAQLQREQAKRIGGMPQQHITDAALIQVSREVAQWYRPTGTLGKLRAEYTQLSKQAQSVRSQYNMPQEQRQQLLNRVVTAQQNNMMKQQQSVQLAEQYLAQKYGKALAPRLGGRLVNMVTLDQMMRESLGTPNLAIADEP